MSEDLERRIFALQQRNAFLVEDLKDRRRKAREYRIQAEQSAGRAEIAERAMRDQRVELDSLRSRLRNLRQ